MSEIASAGPRPLWVLRPSGWQAEHAYRYVGAWLDEIYGRLSTTQSGREPGTNQTTQASVIIDLSEAERLDLTALWLLFSKLSELGITVRVSGAAPHLAISLQSLKQWAAERGSAVIVDEPDDGPGWATVDQDERVPLTVAVPSTLRRLLRVRARRWGATPDDVVVAALQLYLTRPPPVVSSGVGRSQIEQAHTKTEPGREGGRAT